MEVEKELICRTCRKPFPTLKLLRKHNIDEHTTYFMNVQAWLDATTGPLKAAEAEKLLLDNDNA